MKTNFNKIPTIQSDPSEEGMDAARICVSQFYPEIQHRLDSIQSSQVDSIGAAAVVLANQIEKDGLIHVFGVGGHSFIGSEEFFYRAGGLANINPIFDLSLSLAGGGRKSTELERVPGYGNKIVGLHDLREGDPVIITSAYGINSCTIDAALEAKERGCTVISISSFAFAENTPLDFRARHPSQKNLHDIADIAVDNHVPHGEAVLHMDELEQPVGGTCTILGAFCIQWLVVTTVRICLDRGVDPPVWKSANVVGGDEANADYMRRFGNRIKYL